MRKKIIQYLVVTLYAIAIFVACDKIEKPYTTVEGPIEVFCDTPAFSVLDRSNVIQKYLLEEFTGHKCTNCPRGHQIVADMQNLMGDTLIPISIHAGNLADPDAHSEDSCGFSRDFRTTVGTAIFEEFNISRSNPSAMINRIEFNGSRILSDPVWKSTMFGIARQMPQIGLQIIVKHDVEHESACIFVKTTLFENIPQNARITVVMAEKELIAPQKLPPPQPTNCSYHHKHILRACATSTWQGKELGISQANDTAIFYFSIGLKDKNWDVNNCVFIAYIMSPDTKEILQAEEAELTK